MVRHPREYRWSSYRRRALGRPDELLNEDPCYVSLGKTTQDRVRVCPSVASLKSAS